jgi:hypothetical protein
MPSFPGIISSIDDNFLGDGADGPSASCPTANEPPWEAEPRWAQRKPRASQPEHFSQMSRTGSHGETPFLRRIIGDLSAKSSYDDLCFGKVGACGILALPCLALPCLALPCLALPCLALPDVAGALSPAVAQLVSSLPL